MLDALLIVHLVVAFEVAALIVISIYREMKK